MTIWILALILIVCLGLIGYNQGAIRVAMSFIGIIVAAFLAMPLSGSVTPLIKGLLGAFSIKNPVVIWALAPMVVFLVILTMFKVGAFAIHRQVEVYFKYKAGELIFALWERLNKRIGACLGILNAAAYLVILSTVIYVLGYWGVQMAQGESDPKSLRWVSKWAKDLHATGLDKAAASIAPVKEDYYTAADVAGIIYHNPLASSRLSSYPGLLDLAETPEFQAIANDKDFFEMLQRQVPVGEVLSNEKIKSIVTNPDRLKDIWNLLKPDLADLNQYMLTGQSAKYGGEPILGRWDFDLSGSMAALKQAKPNLSATELKVYRKLMSYAFTKGVLVATPSKRATVKGMIWVRPGLKPNEIPTEAVTRAGDWSGDSSEYKVNLADTKVLTAKVESGKIKLTGEWTPLVFVKE